MSREEFNFFARHSKKTKAGEAGSREYSGLTQDGVELGCETAAKELKPLIDQLPKNAVIALIGASDQVRTKSTAQLFGDELKDIYENTRADFEGGSGVIIKTKGDIADPEKSYSKIIKELQQEVAAHPDKKFVIDFPLFINEFSNQPWLNDQGENSEFTTKLLEISGGDQNQAVLNWVDSDGTIEGLQGPQPMESAQRYKQGFNRLREFVKKYVPGRPVFIGGAGHSWDLDAFIAYMTHGKVDSESIRQIMGAEEKMIQETEPFYFKVEPERIISRYRGQDYEFPLADKN